MAGHGQTMGPPDVLLVIHDFEARSSDELSLTKGDRIELIERDDDFGDGWYFGKHVPTGRTGLFPQVYTTAAPKGASTSSSGPTSQPRHMTNPSSESEQTVLSATPTKSVSPPRAREEINASSSSERSRSVDERAEPEKITPPPLKSMPSLQTPRSPDASNVTPASAVPPATQKAIAMASPTSQHAHGDSSPVMNETLSVINEHITDMNTPRHSLTASETRGTNGSGSEYSAPLDPRLSYITGHETDEEEQHTPSTEEIIRWTPAEVSAYLLDLGIDQQHCRIFREQEISGEVLLGLDRESLFLKEFDLGSVGRRLRTWQRIKKLQDEVKGPQTSNNKPAQYGSPDLNLALRTRNGSNQDLGVVSPTSMPNPLVQTQSRGSFHQSQPDGGSPFMRSPMAGFGSPAMQNSPTRPSAASVREMNHSRRHSSVDFNNTSRNRTSIGGTSQAPPSRASIASHRRDHSFDRSWTMGAAATSTTSVSRPASSATNQEYANTHRRVNSSGNMVMESPAIDSEPALTQMDIDRGYFSGGELETRKPRNVLKKRESYAHSRNSSYTEEAKLRHTGTQKRHSRISSAESFSVRQNPLYSKVAALPNAGQVEQARALREHLRKSSHGEPSSLPLPPSEEQSPTVTKLDQGFPLEHSPKTERERATSVQAPAPKKPTRSRATGLRAISDAVTGNEKAVFSPKPESLQSPAKDSPGHSPARTESTTPSGSKSFESDSIEAPKPVSTGGGPTYKAIPLAKAATRRKSKKETSAYIRGLEKKTPQEQMIGCDYSGWMKKKSSNLMTTWKPRLFVLKGRRLSYYYSENDEQEKGLIDISSHRVLPADSDRITGLHATITGASASPTSPQDAQTPTIAATEASAEFRAPNESDAMFIFKLLPPRTGLTKAVNFTKPTIHYFAVDNVKQGRLWMAALMKATIDRDDTKTMITTYQQKTISLAKARQMRQRPPALMDLDEGTDEVDDSPTSEDAGLNISGVQLDGETDEKDSGVAGVGKKMNGTEASTNSNPSTRASTRASITSNPTKEAA